MKLYQVENESIRAIIVSRSEDGAKRAFCSKVGEGDTLINFLGTTLLYDEGCVVMKAFK